MRQASFTLTPIPPYDFDLTFEYATSFWGFTGMESFQDGVFHRLLNLDGHLCLAKVRSSGTVEAPRLEVELVDPAPDEETVEAARHWLARILGIDQDLGPFNRMAEDDQDLAPLVQGLRGLHIPQSASVYEALVFSILGQQISTHVARVQRLLLITTYGPSVEVEGVTYHAFPKPEALTQAGVEGLRSIKLSNAKARYIVDIAAGVRSGELALEGLRDEPDEEVLRTLTGTRGVGAWTAQWLLIRALGRTDGFPDADLALQRTLGFLVNGGVPLQAEEALEYSRRWSPFRSYVITYLFAALRSGRFAQLR